MVASPIAYWRLDMARLYRSTVQFGEPCDIQEGGKLLINFHNRP